MWSVERCATRWGGTTDLACWFPLDGVSELDRASLVDMGLSMRISC
jgi:hypothetical protein